MVSGSVVIQWFSGSKSERLGYPELPKNYSPGNREPELLRVNSDGKMLSNISGMLFTASSGYFPNNSQVHRATPNPMIDYHVPSETSNFGRHTAVVPPM